MQLLKVSTDKLLLVAGIVWLIAGANIVNIGLSAFLDETGWLFWVLIGGTLLIFVLFHIFVFTKMVGKHASRIRGYEEDKTHLFKFFDKKGYIMMAIMMGGGIALRASGVVPEWFIAFFYTGLGAAGGCGRFILALLKLKPACPAMPGTYTKHHMNSWGGNETVTPRRRKRFAAYHGRYRSEGDVLWTVRRANGMIFVVKTTRRCARAYAPARTAGSYRADRQLDRIVDDVLAAAPDCVILDQASGTGGHMVCRDLRRWSQVPVIAHVRTASSTRF
ncbi:MAG: hypothetical protein ACLT98_03825 [Eggerthellaceae bacterium]